MTEPRRTNRRTVLQTMAATAGGSAVVGTATGARANAASTTDGCGNDLTIVATHDEETDDHNFELDADEVAAGWTTIAFENRTDHTHFAYFARLPEEAITAADAAGEELLPFYVEHVTRPFQWFMDDIDPDREPDPEDLSDEYSNLDEEVIFPPWFADVLPSGGPGLTSSETASRATLNLAPGEYIVECYVKDEEGRFHSYLGMIDHLSVTGNRAGTEPDSTLELSLSTEGIDVRDEVHAGEHAVAVRFENQRVYEHLLGHDVHLIRLDDGVTASDVNDWMNWMDPDALVSDGTEPGTFQGGVQTILTPELLGADGGGVETAYFHADLAPGEYAFVSEVPDPAGAGMLQEVTVSAE